MATNSLQNVAGVLLKEVPLSQMHGFVKGMSAAENGTGCGAGCGGGCSKALDQFAHVLNPADLQAAAADKAGLLSEVAKQAAQQVQGLHT